MRGDAPHPKGEANEPHREHGERERPAIVPLDTRGNLGVPARMPNPGDLARMLEAKKQTPSGITPEKPDRDAPRMPNPGHLADMLKRRRASSGEALREDPGSANMPAQSNHASLTQQIGHSLQRASGISEVANPLDHDDQRHSPGEPTKGQSVTDRPAAGSSIPTPADLARSLGRGTATRRVTPDVEKMAPGTTERGDQQIAHTAISPHEKSTLAQQLEGTNLEKHDRTREHLQRLGQVAVNSLPEGLQDLTIAAQSELSKSIGYYKDGRIDETGLREVIGRIGGPYTMYLSGTNYPEYMLANRTSGLVAELRCANQLMQTDQSASKIYFGARPGREYTLEHLTTGAAERIDIAPITDADVLYLGHDGKVHIDEIKETANALYHTLRKGPEQLQNLAAWQNQAPEKREARIAVDRLDSWTDLFKQIDAKQPASPNVTDLLVAHRLPIHLGNTTFRPEELMALQEKAQQALGGVSGARRDELLRRLSRFSPRDVAQGKF